MKIAYFPNQTALQSEPIWQAFLEGCKNNNITPVENSMDADAAVIWSVLWHGRMGSNQEVYNYYRNQNKPVFIIEVGALKRGTTWKISLNHIGALGIFPNSRELDNDRPKKLGMTLYPVRHDARTSILIAAQHDKSLQWENLPPMDKWIEEKIHQLRLYTDRRIVVRQHPRCPIRVPAFKGVVAEIPRKMVDTYDEFDISYNYHAVVNNCSGPSIQAAIRGLPVICDRSSLAYPVSVPISEIENPKIPNREEWFIKICHTEWTVEEIRQGLPIQRLLFDI